MVKNEQRKKERNEFRRLKLLGLILKECDGVNAKMARILEKEPSYINRLLYPEGKKGKKNIGDDIMSDVIDAFNLPEDWWVLSDEDLKYTINPKKLSVGKWAHIKEVEAMSEEEFQSEEGVFKAVVKSAKSKKGKGQESQ